MPKPEEHKLQKHTLNLFEGDFSRLRDIHGDPGAGAIIRRLVRAHIMQAESNVKPKRVKVEGLA